MNSYCICLLEKFIFVSSSSISESIIGSTPKKTRLKKNIYFLVDYKSRLFRQTSLSSENLVADYADDKVIILIDKKSPYCLCKSPNSSQLNI